MSNWQRLRRYLGLETRGAEARGSPEGQTVGQISSDIPNQRQLDQFLSRVDRIRVIDGGVADGEVLGTDVLLDVHGRDHAQALSGALRISEDPGGFGRCMCLGDPGLELFEGSQRLATLGHHHGLAIRWHGWKSDARLLAADPILDWFSARGVHGPRAEFDEAAATSQRAKAQATRWVDAMPRSLRQYWPERHDCPTSADPEMAAALASEFPESVTRARVLLEWLGHGSGLWSGHPAYESVPELLLLLLPLDVLLASAETARGPGIEGAARLFGGWAMSQRHPNAAGQLPPPVRQRLLEHALASTSEDKHIRARAAFGQSR